MCARCVWDMCGRTVVLPFQVVLRCCVFSNLQKLRTTSESDSVPGPHHSSNAGVPPAAPYAECFGAIRQLLRNEAADGFNIDAPSSPRQQIRHAFPTVIARALSPQPNRSQTRRKCIDVGF
jgi:hypothetical protein